MAEPAASALRRLSEARGGSPEAMGELLEACRAYLLAIAERELDAPLRSKGGASDLVQETFLEAQRDFPAFQGTSEAELLAWLRRMLLNNLNNFARRYRGTDKRQMHREVFVDELASAGGTVPISGDTPTPSRQVMADEESQALMAAIGRLPADYQQVLTLRYLEDRAFDDIAERMGRNSNAVRQLWLRAVGRLQQEMGT